MLRSFDYAAAMAVGPGEANEVAEAQKRELIGRFVDVSSKAFLKAYAAATKAGATSLGRCSIGSRDD